MNIFGTDGVRGKVNEWPMTAELVQKIAISAGSVYIGKAGSSIYPDNLVSLPITTLFKLEPAFPM